MKINFSTEDIFTAFVDMNNNNRFMTKSLILSYFHILFIYLFFYVPYTAHGSDTIGE